MTAEEIVASPWYDDSVKHTARQRLQKLAAYAEQRKPFSLVYAIVVVVLLGMIAAGFWFVPRRMHESSEQLTTAVLQGDEPQASRALAGLRRLGPHVAPADVERLVEADVSAERKQRIYSSLSALGHAALAPVTALVERDDAQALAAIDVLKRMGPIAAVSLTRGLSSKSAAVRDAANQALMSFGSEAVDALALTYEPGKDITWLVLLNPIDPYWPRRSSPNPHFNKLAGDYLIVAEYIKGLDDDDQWDRRGARRRALEALKRLGPASRVAEFALVEALDDSAANVRLRAAETMTHVGPSKAAVPALLAGLSVKNYFGPDGKKRFLARSQRRAIIEALQAAGANSVPLLHQAFDANDVWIRTGAAIALKRIVPQSPKAIPVLLTMQCSLRKGEEQLSFEIAKVLDGLDWQKTPSVRTAIPALIRAFAVRDKKSIGRSEAAYALGKIGTSDDRVVPALIQGLANNETCYLAATTLEDIGPDAKAAVSALIKLLGHRKDGMRFAA